MAEAKAVGLKEQSPLGWSLARRALPFQRDGFSLTLLRLKLEFANRIMKSSCYKTAPNELGFRFYFSPIYRALLSSSEMNFRAGHAS
ncbi:MAG: hypothetical protein HYR94_05685 [Chloroflexi bacterium]|nr:hypothetical protein [Chloroflexota bacterium]